MAVFGAKMKEVGVAESRIRAYTGFIDLTIIMERMKEHEQFTGDSAKDARTCAQLQRLLEIEEFVNSKGGGRPYSILDDLDLTEAAKERGLEQHFIKVDPDSGLTESNAEAAKQAMLHEEPRQRGR